jgi:hypothetical protein
MAYATNNFGNIRLTSSVAVAIAAIGTWYVIASGFVAGLLNSFSLSGANGLVCNGAGTFYLTAQASIEVANPNQKMGLTYAINGVVASVSATAATATGGNPACLVVSDIVTLKVGDIVTLWVKNATAPTALTVDTAILSLARLQR